MVNNFQTKRKPKIADMNAALERVQLKKWVPNIKPSSSVVRDLKCIENWENGVGREAAKLMPSFVQKTNQGSLVVQAVPKEPWWHFIRTLRLPFFMQFSPEDLFETKGVPSSNIQELTRKQCLKDQWRLFIKMATDWQVSEVGDTCRPAARSGRRRSLQIEWLSAGTAHLGFPALLSVPRLLSREIVMNRRHSKWNDVIDWDKKSSTFRSRSLLERKTDIPIKTMLKHFWAKGNYPEPL